MSTSLSLLLVEDSEDDALLIVRELKRVEFDVHFRRVETESALRQALKDEPWDLVISDFNMPGLTGLHALEIVREQGKDLPFILVSGSIGEQLAVQAMKAGAQDYLMKDNLARLGSAVTRELQDSGERRRRRSAESELEDKNRQLIAAQRMEAIGRLAGGIAHDLNNMIGACTLYAEMALDPKQDIAVVRENVREIVKAQERATRLVDQLLAFSRRQMVDPRLITLNQVIGDIQKMLSKILGEDIELSIELDPSIRPIKADPIQIDQVLMNLVVNARDAMPKGGRLSIRTANEMLESDHGLLAPGSELLPGPYAKLSITDTGTGMDDETRARIFEPFFTTKGIGKGTGLGLATVYGIVEQARGSIVVRSELGKGTTFDVYIPAVNGPGTEPSTERLPQNKSAVPSVRTLLLVEDEAPFRDAMRRVLGNLGYRVLLAKDGEEGASLFSRHCNEIDLLITDVVMPKISGPEMVTLVREKNPEIKVLFMSGYSQETVTSHGVDHKSTFLLRKPFTMKQVTEKITEILGGSDE